jgi:peptidoglycan/LPS O-acetylase OafA/YrhL
LPSTVRSTGRGREVTPINVHQTRVLELDGIRGIAISAVFLFHLGGFIHEHVKTQIGQFVLHAFGLGWVGVDLFFVLSGFLITSILIETKEEPGYFRNFYARRVLRIFPLYYLCLAIVAALFLALPAARGSYAGLYQAQVWYWVHLQNWISAFSPFPAAFLGHFWSLAIEEQFYIFWPLVVWFLDRRFLLLVCCAIAGSSLAIRLGVAIIAPSDQAQVFLYYSTVTRLDCIAMGAIAAIVVEEGISRQQLRFYAMAVGLPSLLALSAIAVTNTSEFWGNWPMATVGLTFSAAASVGVLLHGLRGSRFLRWTPLRVIGLYSYAAYLVHWPVMMITDRLLAHADITGATFVSLFVPISLGATFALAYLSWHLIEKRCLAQRARFAAVQHTSKAIVPQAA